MASGTVLECSTSHEKDNFVRFSTLLIDGGTALLREVLDTICSPTSLRQGLTNNKRSIERSLKRDQKAILYPADGSPLRLESCDISLLIVMLKEVCKISFPSREELKTLPDVKRSEVGDNLERLKVCRNEVFAHAPKLELSNSEFERQWDEISTVMLQLAKKIKKEPKWKERIDHYRSVALKTKEEDCVRKLKEWHECEKEVLKEVQESRGEMKEGFANVLDVLDGIQGFMNSLCSSSNQDMQISKASMELAHTIQDGLPACAEIKRGEPTLRELADLSTEICCCWHRLGYQLGLEAEIEGIAANNVQFPSPQKKALQMLIVWHDKGASSTYVQLSKALMQSSKDRLAQKYWQQQADKALGPNCEPAMQVLHHLSKDSTSS